MITVDQFRENYPEFADTARFTPEAITRYLRLAYSRLNVNRWDDQLDFGAQLFTAHFITLQALDVEAVNMGGAPGQNPGIMTNQATEVTAAFDVQSTIEEGAGHWNLTTYGKQFIRLANISGMGGIQL